MTPPPPPSPDRAPNDATRAEQPTRILITAGPTHEPIDTVRFLSNRSSGRLGVALADAAAQRNLHTTLLLGPTNAEPTDTRIDLHRFRTAADLEALLDRHFPACDVLVMAAAVADFRPVAPADPAHTKLKRTADALTLRLEPTPDLVAACAARRSPSQLIVGFALEPRDRLEASALDKLRRKGLDAIVANPLETMDATTIDAALITSDERHDTGRPIPKADFATWLLDRIDALRARP